MHLLEIRFHHTFNVHQGQDRLILIMSQQFALLCQTHGIDTVRFEYHDCKVSTDRYHHQRKEQVISPCQLGNEEDTCQRCMHHARHHPCHTQQGKVLFRNIIRNKRCQRIAIAEVREDKSHDTAQEQTRSKSTPATSTTIGSTRCKHLEQDNQSQINQQQIAISVEDRVVHNFIPIGNRRTVQQHVNGIVAFTIKGREHKNQETQHGPTNHQLDIRIAISTENSFNPVHRTGEIKGHQTTKDAQQQYSRNTFHQERFVHAEFKHRLRTMQDIRYRSSRHTGYEQRKQRAHGQVNHQDFKRKHQSGNRSLEDTCYGTSSPTTHQQHQRTVLHLEHATQIRADSRTGQHNRCFRSDRSTETNGYGTGKQGRPGVMSFDSTLPTGNSI